VFSEGVANIESVNVIEIINAKSRKLPRLVRLTIVVAGSATIIEQLRKQLEKIVDVVRVVDISTTKGTV